VTAGEQSAEEGAGQAADQSAGQAAAHGVRPADAGCGPGAAVGRAGRRFAGRVAIVTGASRGIGLAVARRLVAEGARVTITARGAEALDMAAEELGGPGTALAVPGKADDAASRARAVDATLESFGRLDVLVNNTGINPVAGPVTSVDPGAVLKIFGVNVAAALAWVEQARLAGLGEHAGAAVVNVASVAGLRPSPPIGVYGVSKAALIHATAQLALELAPRIRVNAVAPAVVKTVFATMLYEGREEQVAAAYPLRRLGVPDDVASAVAFLASDDAAWITGQTLPVDGGLLLGGGLGPSGSVL
jgi:NAD(P)-dependent dehydrogenase (short-subunit alcohol dehydrogenase family)